MFIGDPLGRRAVYSPDATALILASEEVTSRPRIDYAALNARANRTAAALRAAGIGRGDRVALLARDGIVFYDAFFACGKLGAVLVPLNWRLRISELVLQLERTRPAVFYCDASGDTVDATTRSALGAAVRHLRDVEELAGFATTGADDAVVCDDVRESDTACLIFTGGTTGAPKAAQISHGQIAWNTFNSVLADVRSTDSFLNVFPMFHTGGLFAFSVPLLILGGTVVQVARFDAGQILRLIAEERVTVFGGVPTMFRMMTESPAWPAADLSSLRFCMSGGAPMPVPLIHRYREEKGVVFRQGFGMTEFGPGVFSLPAELAITKAGSIGRPNFFVEARIVDPATNRPVATGVAGELVLRGPSAMTGYFADPVATAQVFDADGWLHTGDLARVDADGCFFIVDRLKDMYISGGENVYPSEIEAVLHGHPAVSQAAVVGVDDERWGQVGEAHIVLRPGTSATAEELIDWAAQRLAKYKVPRRVVIRAALPTTPVGKVLKRALRTPIDDLASPGASS